MLRNTVGLFSGHVIGYDLPESIRAEDLDVEAGTIMDIFRQVFSEPVRFESWQTKMPDLRQHIDLEVVSIHQPGYGYRAADRSAHARPGKGPGLHHHHVDP